MYNKIYDYSYKRFKSKKIILSDKELKELVYRYVQYNNLDYKQPKKVFESILLNFCNILFIILKLLDNDDDKTKIRKMINQKFIKSINEFNKLEQQKRKIAINNDLDI